MNIMKLAYHPLLLGFVLILGMINIDQYCDLSFREACIKVHIMEISVGYQFQLSVMVWLTECSKRLVVLYNLTV